MAANEKSKISCSGRVKKAADGLYGNAVSLRDKDSQLSPRPLRFVLRIHCPGGSIIREGEYRWIGGEGKLPKLSQHTKTISITL